VSMGKAVNVVVGLLNRRVGGRVTGGNMSRGVWHVDCVTKVVCWET
jgi:hypothetical protein